MCVVVALALAGCGSSSNEPTRDDVNAARDRIDQQVYGDSDGDGVANWEDAAPENPDVQSR